MRSAKAPLLCGMRWITLPLALSLALSATAGLSADAPLRPEALRRAMGLKLGGWQTVFKVRDFKAEFPDGVNSEEAEQAVAAFRAKLEKDRIKNECLSDIPERLNLPGVHPPKACDFSRIEARDGKFLIKSLCKADSGTTLEAVVEGEYGPERMTARSEVASSDGGVFLRIKMDSESRFTGPCASSPVAGTPPAKGD